MSAHSLPIRHVAIVGAGVSGFIAAVTLRYRGLPTEEMVLYDDRPDFLDTWSGSTGAIAQQVMRSESEGHFYATDFPGFALLDALHRLSPLPLLRSAANRYNPRLDDILAHGRAIADHYAIAHSVQPTRVARIERVQDQEPHFALYDADHRICGRARNALLALGHGAWRWPAVCADPAVRAELGGLLSHAYGPKAYGGGRVLVIGSGMSAATEWINILRAGGSVIAVHRAPTLVEQPLSAPRCAFGGPWLDRYHAMGLERAEVLAGLARGSYSGGGSTRRLLREAQTAGRLEMRAGEVTAMRRQGSGVGVVVASENCEGSETLEVDSVISATGFASGWQEYELLRTLVDQYDLPTHAGHLLTADDCSIPLLSMDRSVLSVSGPAARWAYPAADSFAGMKYAARRFTARVVDERRNPWMASGAWLDMVRGGWPYGGDRARRERGSSPCASP